MKVKFKMDDGTIVDLEVEQVWKEAEVGFREDLLELCGNDEEKARRLLAFLVEITNDYPDGVVPMEVVMKVAKRWEVVDVVVSEMTKVFVERFFVLEGTT